MLQVCSCETYYPLTFVSRIFSQITVLEVAVRHTDQKIYYPTYRDSAGCHIIWLNFTVTYLLTSTQVYLIAVAAIHSHTPLVSTHTCWPVPVLLNLSPKKQLEYFTYSVISTAADLLIKIIKTNMMLNNITRGRTRPLLNMRGCMEVRYRRNIRSGKFSFCFSAEHVQ